jgi:hypothetical protein
MPIPPEFTPDVCERIIHAALQQRDWEGLGYALQLLAVQDPHRAQTLVDVMRAGIAINSQTGAGQ